MENILIHNFEIPVKGIKKKIIYQFSDLHLTEYDELSNEEETEFAKEKTLSWKGTSKYFADTYSETYVEPRLQSTMEYFDRLLEVSADGDILLLAGDIMDFVNGANPRCIEKMLDKVSKPFMYVPGNHELPEDLPDRGIFKSVKKPFQILEDEDLIILGLDDTSHMITAEQNAVLQEILKKGKPIIILMHIPIFAPALKDCEEYFYLDCDSAQGGNSEFLNTIKENAENIIAVCAGHLHFGNVSEIAPGVTQYVSSQGIIGNINRYVIGC